MLRNMLNNRLVILLIFIAIGCFVQCAQDSKEENVRVDSLDNFKKVEDSLQIISTAKVFIQSGNLNFFYNDSTAILSFIFNNQRFTIGEFRNTFDIAPNVETKQVDSLVYITVINKFFDLGQGFDVLTIYLFDKKEQNLKQLIETEEVGIHDMSVDTLPKIKHYDYRIEEQKQRLVIEEYHPYKSSDNISQKYRTTTRNYSFK